MLSQKYRFHGHGSLRYVYKHGESVRGRLITIKYVKNPHRKNSRVSVVVSKKVLKSAVGRNRIRRRIYEIIRQQLPEIEKVGTFDIVVMVFSPEVRTIEYGELCSIVCQQLAAAKVIGICYNKSIMNSQDIISITQNIGTSYNKVEVIGLISQALERAGFTVVETNTDKPWGGYLRLKDGDAPEFIKSFFPNISLEEAQKGDPSASLSPKILFVDPKLRLSWQWHRRRSECWIFLTNGYFCRSLTDEQTDRQAARSGDCIEFYAEERHRLIGGDSSPTVVAEIWQHTDKSHLSDEDDIIRVQDDFSR